MKFYIHKKIILSLLIIPFFFIGSSFYLNSSSETITPYFYNSSKRPLTTEEKREELIKSASEYIGNDYIYGSSGPVFFDCSGFTRFIFSETGIDLDRSSLQQSRMGKRVPINSVKPGDLLFFSTNGSIHHVGLIVKNEIDKLWIIHSVETRGVVLEDVFSSNYWSPRILFAKDIFSEINSYSEEFELITFF